MLKMHQLNYNFLYYFLFTWPKFLELLQVRWIPTEEPLVIVPCSFDRPNAITLHKADCGTWHQRNLQNASSKAKPNHRIL